MNIDEAVYIICETSYVDLSRVAPEDLAHYEECIIQHAKNLKPFFDKYVNTDRLPKRFLIQI